MKQLPYINEISRNVSSIDVFSGLNLNFKIDENELAKSENMTTSFYPVLSTRKKRKILKATEDGSDIFSVAGGISSALIINDTLATLTRTGVFTYGKYCTDLGVTDNKMIRYANMIYIYPSCILITLPNEVHGETKIKKIPEKIEFVSINDIEYEQEDKITGSILFQPTIVGSEDRVFYTKPKEPKPGDYYYNDNDGMQIYSAVNGSAEYAWTGTEPTGIRLVALKDDSEFVPLKDMYTVNDVIFISNTKNERLDKSYVVYKIGKNDDAGIYLNGYVDRAVTVQSVILEKKIPYGLDFVFENKNRLFGCFSGYDEKGKYVNEIYVSAMNDPTNWYRYDGTVSQCYTVSVTSDGCFTGAAVINGYPTFFKEDCMYRIYGDSPNEFQLISFDCAGIQEGSEKSLAGYNGTYYYKSNIGIMRISDGYPVKISEALSDELTGNVTGGTDGIYYYAAIKDENNTSKIYVYDINRGLWQCETSDKNIRQFLKYRNMLFSVGEYISESSQKKIDELYELYLNAENVIVRTRYYLLWIEAKLSAEYKISLELFSVSSDFDKVNICINSGEKIVTLKYFDEDDFSWCFETGEISYSYYSMKYIEKIFIRVKADFYARADIDILYNTSKEWHSLQAIYGENETKTYEICIRPQKCDSFRIRFAGTGDVKILSSTVFFTQSN